MVLQRGDCVGGFQLGSSVVLVFEAPVSFQFTVSPGDRVQYGQPLGDTLERHAEKHNIAQR